MKKFYLLLFCSMVCGVLNVQAQTDTIATGTTGDCRWRINGSMGDFTITIEGVGAMEDYWSESTVPWYNLRTSITKINIGSNVTRIGSYAFYYCSSLTSVNIPESVTEIGSSAFSYCSSLTSINIPESVTKIGSYAFSYCSSLTSVNIPESVNEIGSSAFSHCSSLTSVNISKGVTYIGDDAFMYCDNLVSVTVNWTNPIDINPTVFGYIKTDEVDLNVPAGTEEDYKATDVWKFFRINGVFALPSGKCGENLEWEITGSPRNYNLTIRGSGKMTDYMQYSYSEGNYSYNYMPWYNIRESITSINIDEGANSIGSHAFSNCENHSW